MGIRYQKRKKQKEATLIETIIYIICMCLAVFLILKYVGQRTVVRGSSMDNTLQDGQSLIMDKLSYRFHDPERFDIVIFPGPVEAGEDPYYIKRVIGLPGETVQIIEGKVTINGKELTEDIYGITDYIDEPGMAAEPLVLGEDEYFCLGDNRPVSFDCRYPEVGPVSKDEIIGKAWIRIWPLSKFGSIPAQGKE